VGTKSAGLKKCSVAVVTVMVSVAMGVVWDTGLGSASGAAAEVMAFLRGWLHGGGWCRSLCRGEDHKGR
jgi:hypothetical protein